MIKIAGFAIIPMLLEILKVICLSTELIIIHQLDQPDLFIA